MNPRASVAIFATYSEGHNEWVALVRSYLQGLDSTPVGITLIASRKMIEDITHGRMPEGLSVLEVQAGQGALHVWKLFQALRFASPQGFSVVMANTSSEHHAALLHKLASREPVTIVKTRFRQEAIAENPVNTLVHRRLIGINLYLRREDRDFYKTSAGNGLSLDRPCLLEQPQLGSHSTRQMMDHVVKALTLPARESLTGRKQDHSHIDLAYITHFYMNQQNAGTATDLIRHYASYSPELLDRIQFVVVDDGSPVDYEIPDVDLNLTWLKVSRDIPWNMAGARNLGALHAKSDKIVITDIDHLFPEQTLRGLADRGPCGKRFYKFWRLNEPEQRLYKGHPNIFFMSRGRFFELHGYDEEFSGAYGAEDFRFVKCLKAAGSVQMYLPRRLHILDRKGIDRASSYHTLMRDLSFNTPVDYRKWVELESYGHGAGHSRMFLNFHWERLADRWRTVKSKRPVDRWWKRRWWLRTILPRY